jgi:hypothetical protein
MSDAYAPGYADDDQRPAVLELELVTLVGIGGAVIAVAQACDGGRASDVYGDFGGIVQIGVIAIVHGFHRNEGEILPVGLKIGVIGNTVGRPQKRQGTIRIVDVGC